jgi:hypothetical protein
MGYKKHEFAGISDELVLYCQTLFHPENIIKMATGIVHSGSSEHSAPHLHTAPSQAPPSFKSHDVTTQLFYYKDPGDGSKPPPNIVGKVDTYERPSESLTHTVKDIRGNESQYALDTHGFQIHVQESQEKDFLDDEQIKAVYYPEVDQLLKDV